METSVPKWPQKPSQSIQIPGGPCRQTPKVGIAAKTVLLPALRKMNQELTKRVGDGRENFEAMKFDRLDEFLRVGCKVGIFTVLPVSSYMSSA